MSEWEDHDLDDEYRANLLDPALLLRMFRYGVVYWPRMVVGVLLAGVSSFLWLLPPLLGGAMIDLVFQAAVDGPGPGRFILNWIHGVVSTFTTESFGQLPASTQIWTFAGLALGIRVLQFAVDWTNGYLLAGLGQRVIYDLRMQVFTHIHGLETAWFHKNPVGRLVTRVANDVGALEDMFSTAFVMIIKDVGMLIGVTIMILILNAQIGLAALGIVPFMVAAALVFRKYSRAAYRRWRVALSRLNAHIAESLSGIRVVQLFTMERRSRRRHDELSRDYKTAWMEQRRAWAVFRPVSTILSAGGTGVVIWFGGAAVLTGFALNQQDPKPSPAEFAALGGITMGTLYTFLAYVEQFFQPIRDLTEKLDVIQSAMTAAERIFTTLDETARIEERPDAVDPGRLRGEVEIRDVRFSYHPEEPVLRGIDVHIRPGSTFAIVGPTGAGKSTIINLLCRLYDVNEGAVLVDGRDIRDYSLRPYRKNVAVVHQDVFLFAGSLLENIRLGDESISRERVAKACRAVRADRFIERLPDGYDNELEEGGKTLSAGERQLLSFARALVVDPAILVLDEATASVDTHTEELIQRAVTTLTTGRTSIVIAHRLSTIRQADRILVVADGRITEQGTHAELIALRGAYHRLYRMQFAESGPDGPKPGD
ncbi:MAG: ABC transporter ATP-binding protein [Planctomycetota bacterium]